MYLNSVVGEILVHKETGRPCIVISEEDIGKLKDRNARDVVFSVEFKDGTRQECRQNELLFFINDHERLTAEGLFPNSVS